MLRRRGRVVLIAAVLALVLTAAGWGLRWSLLDTAETVRGDFEEVTAMIPLPPGAAWSDPNLDEDGFYGQEAALMMAQWQATCAWFEYWNEGDSAQRAEALAGFERIRATMHTPSSRRVRGRARPLRRAPPRLRRGSSPT